MEENKKPENPNAFPSEYHNPHSGIVHTDEGMSLRDYFAAKAMQGMLASDIDGNCKKEYVVNTSYEIADAMLEARNDK